MTYDHGKSCNEPLGDGAAAVAAAIKEGDEPAAAILKLINTLCRETRD